MNKTVKVRYAVLNGFSEGVWTLLYQMPTASYILPALRGKYYCHNGSGRFMYFDASEIIEGI